MCQLSVITKSLKGFIAFVLKKAGVSHDVGAAAFWSLVESFLAPFYY